MIKMREGIPFSLNEEIYQNVKYTFFYDQINKIIVVYPYSRNHNLVHIKNKNNSLRT